MNFLTLNAMPPFSGVFRGRATVRCLPFGPTMKIFKATLYEKMLFCRFPARIAKLNNV